MSKYVDCNKQNQPPSIGISTLCQSLETLFGHKIRWIYFAKGANILFGQPMPLDLPKP